jgi:mannose-6-phosphate isomerase-like protein (cupin superfamily)
MPDRVAFESLHAATGRCSETGASRSAILHPCRITGLARGALSSAFGLLALIFVGTPICAQDTGHIFGNEQILNTAESLRSQLEKSKSDSTGVAETRLDEVTFVVVRVKSGRAEVHKTSDDVFFVLSGEATLVTGGKVMNPSGDQEIRGDSIAGGASATVEKGQVIHIPQSVPHQLLLTEGGTLVYVLIKIPR